MLSVILLTASNCLNPPLILYVEKTCHHNKLSPQHTPTEERMMKDNGDDAGTGLLSEHIEYGALSRPRSRSRRLSGEDDAALALFRDEQELHELIDPEQEGKLVRKIDLMILP
jgi:hypothetical protein